MNTFTTTKSARSEVWKKFLALRDHGAMLFDTVNGRSLVCVPSKKSPDLFTGDGLWAGFIEYDGKAIWKHCEEVYEFFVEKEDGQQIGEFKITDFLPGLEFEEYEKKISEIKHYLTEGETYQVNFAHAFRGKFFGDPFALYSAIFAKNPTAMSFYYEENGRAICSNSPERLFSLKNGILRSEPIKGTVGADEDPNFLLQNEKSEAELTMIVDLLRNDLGRVGKNVRVTKNREIMKLANVFHTYSVIEADLCPGTSIPQILEAVFPGGSVTGCPKIRTMEIIAKLENFKRGAYCGSAGYVWKGEADFNIMIRTATIRDSDIVFPSGGGIVFDSDAHSEYKETLKKAAILYLLSKTNLPV